MIKKYIEKRKLKEKEYWDNLNYEKEYEKQHIKDLKAMRSYRASKGCLLEAIAAFVIVLIIPCTILVASLSYHFFDYEHYQQIVSIGGNK